MLVVFSGDSQTPVELGRIVQPRNSATRLRHRRAGGDRRVALALSEVRHGESFTLPVVPLLCPFAGCFPPVERLVRLGDRVVPALLRYRHSAFRLLRTGPGCGPVPLEEKHGYSFDACFSRSCLICADLLCDEPAVRPREPAGVREEALRFREPPPVFVPDFGSGFAGRLDELALDVLDFAGAPDGDVALRVVAFRAFPGPSFAAVFAAVFVDVLVFPGVRA